MKKIVLFCVLALTIACSSSSEEVLRSGNSITLFQLQINGQVISGQINQTSSTIVFNVTDASLVSLKPTITISEGATINPSPSSPRNFTQEVEYTVTAEDGTQKVYTVIVNNRILNNENLITLFQLPINGEIINVETPDIVYHPRRVKVTIAGRTKLTPPRRAKVYHL
ncbi:DUF5018 domain-containing protein [Flagellimonas lutaonensis]|uniref:DUF5018 domain-containing protein n=1 Tax=Flagellimonas lutaonensis TaxID=516051 RepID=A0A0D5YSU4_9FLAO|nr:DUF5018 domain-containing protein [Allomuricauda lutaonensis]AKA35330.1 hypothetical protein VC82_1718 [Allomuricauda lutaonensis]